MCNTRGDPEPQWDLQWQHASMMWPMKADTSSTKLRKLELGLIDSYFCIWKCDSSELLLMMISQFGCCKLFDSCKQHEQKFVENMTQTCLGKLLCSSIFSINCSSKLYLPSSVSAVDLESSRRTWSEDSFSSFLKLENIVICSKFIRQLMECRPCSGWRSKWWCAHITKITPNNT